MKCNPVAPAARTVGCILSALVAGTGCASGGGAARPPATPSGQSAAPAAPGAPAEVARAFWAALAGHDPARAAALASFPFDLDAHNGCVESEGELRDLLAKPGAPPGTRIVIGEVREILPGQPAAKPAAWTEDHWRRHLTTFTSPEAQCLGPPAAAEVYRTYFVEFTVGGEAVGSLTRVRCLGAICTVAGTDN
jgi:hypothetical protein